MMIKLKSRGFIGVLILCAWSVSAQGASVVLPPSLASTEANDNFAFNSNYTQQQLFTGSALAGLPVGATITGMEFRLDGGQPTNGAVTTANFDVRLGKSTTATLSTDFASNEAADTVLARSGSYTFVAGSLSGSATPNAFGSLIAFTTPYVFTGGSLLLTFSYTTPGAQLLFDYQDGSAPISGLQSGGTVTYNGTTAISIQNGEGLAIQFIYTVPEPSSLLLVAVGLGCLASRRRLRLKPGSGSDEQATILRRVPSENGSI